MGKSFLGEFGYTIFGAAIIGGFIVLALIITPIALIGIPAYIAFRLWRDSPARAERLAHVETMTLYNHAVAGQITLSDEEIDAALAQHWPQDTPRRSRCSCATLDAVSMKRRVLIPRCHRHRHCAIPLKVGGIAINSRGSAKPAGIG